MNGILPTNFVHAVKNTDSRLSIRRIGSSFNRYRRRCNENERCQLGKRRKVVNAFFERHVRENLKCGLWRRRILTFTSHMFFPRFFTSNPFTSNTVTSNTVASSTFTSNTVASNTFTSNTFTSNTDRIVETCSDTWQAGIATGSITV